VYEPLALPIVSSSPATRPGPLGQMPRSWQPGYGLTRVRARTAMALRWLADHLDASGHRGHPRTV
jgi:hypothetical protein